MIVQFTFKSGVQVEVECKTFEWNDNRSAQWTNYASGHTDLQHFNLAEVVCITTRPGTPEREVS